MRLLFCKFGVPEPGKAALKLSSITNLSIVLCILCGVASLLCPTSKALANSQDAKAPTALKVANLGDGRRVAVSWQDRSVKARGFRIQRKRISKSAKTIVKNIRSNKSPIIDSPGPGRFSYRIQSFNRVSSSKFTNWIAVDVKNTSLPTPTVIPTNTPTPYIEGVNECNDNVDNDSDGNIDLNDNGCFGPNQRESINSSDGWTRFNPSSDSKIIYVSSSEGSDCLECGLSPNRPLRTISAGSALVRNGYPDWLLLKRGDQWIGESLADGSWTKSGRSTTEKIVIGGYGAGTRPIIYVTNGNVGFSQTHPISHVAIVGLHLEAYQREWYDDPSGIRAIGSASDILYEDLFIKGFGTNVIIQSSGSSIQSDISLRRNVIVDAWSATSHSQGIFSSAVDGLLLEENVFDHNGWADGACRATLTSATWNAGQRILSQVGAFTNLTKPDLWSNGGTIEITGGLFATGYVSNPTNTATGMVFRGDSSLSSVDDFYTNKYLKFTSGNNPGNARTNRFQRITNYNGATREFTVTRTGDEFSPPADGDTFRIDTMGLFTIEERIDDNSIRLVNNDLSPYDLTAGDITSGVGVAATIFNRSMYLSGGNGRTITRRNIDSNGASGGIQQRKGGDAVENLFLRAPLALSFGHAQNASGTVTGSIVGNVIIDARDIEDAPRGFGITVTGNGPYQGGSTVYADNISIRENIVAHNTHGTANLFGFSLGNWSTNINFQSNIVYDWVSPTNNGFAFSKSSGAQVSNISLIDNDFQQPRAGSLIISYDQTFLPATLQLLNNRYYSADLANRWFYFNNGYKTANAWSSTANDISATNVIQYSDPDRNIETYMASLELSPNYDQFILKTRELSKTNWNPKFLAISVINYIRAGYDKAALPE